MKARSTGHDRQAVCGVQVRSDVRRMGRLRRRMANALKLADGGIGTRHTAGDQRQLGRRPDLRGMALQDDGQALPVCSRRPNGNMRRAPEPRRPITGATRSARGTPTATAAAASGTTNRPHQSARSPQMSLASTTWPATCGNGCRIAIMITIKARPPTARRGPVVIAVAVSSAAVPGTAFHGSFARPAATGSPPNDRYDDLGFRVGRTLSAGPARSRWRRAYTKRPGLSMMSTVGAA